MWRKKKTKEPPKETDDQKRDRESQENSVNIEKLYEVAPEVDPLDEYNHKQAVAGFYYLMCREHGFYLSSEMATTFYDTQKHIIKKTEQYSNRLPKADVD